MNADGNSDLQQIRGGAEAFNVTVVEANQTSKRIVLFAVGRGGNPSRHLPLLRSVAALGCTVIAQAQFLKEVLLLQGPIDICLDEEAGHFSYMDELPPNITDSHPNRRKFLASLANDVGRIVIA